MARGSRPGERRGGRQKGTPNKKTTAIREKLDRLGLDPIEGMARIALGDVPCPVCKGEGRISYPGSEPGFGCEPCHGSGRELVAIELRARMLSELASYVEPKRKAVDHDGDSNDQLVVEVVRFCPDD